MPLTLHHICQYLPHGLKVKERYDTICDIMDVSIILGGVKLRSWDGYTRFEDFQLVLRPLSDLTREITHKGETFVPVTRMITRGADSDFWTDPDIECMMWHDVKVLHELMFDTGKLIERRLAISTHDLKEDPYK